MKIALLFLHDLPALGCKITNIPVLPPLKPDILLVFFFFLSGILLF